MSTGKQAYAIAFLVVFSAAAVRADDGRETTSVRHVASDGVSFEYVDSEYYDAEDKAKEGTTKSPSDATAAGCQPSASCCNSCDGGCSACSSCCEPCAPSCCGCVSDAPWTHVGRESITMIRARQVTITSPDDLIAHVDGEMLCTDAHRIEFEILPQRLRVRC